MPERHIPYPPEFRRQIVEREGQAGVAWIERLPDIVHELQDRWNLEISGEALFGYTAVVVPVQERSRSRAARALKVRWMDPSTRDEGAGLRAWDGRGAVRLYREAPEVGALLLEWLDPHRSLLDVPEAEAVDVAARLLRRLAIPAPDGIRTLQVEVDEMRVELGRRWESAGWPRPRSRLDRLLALADELATTDAGHLVDYDLHYENVLAGTREPWLAIDPKVATGDLEFAVAPLLWNRAEALDGPSDLEARLARIVKLADLDHERARLWTIVRLVDVTIWSLSVGQGRTAETCRRLLEWLEWSQALDG